MNEINIKMETKIVEPKSTKVIKCICCGREKASELVAIYRRILPMNQTTMLDAKNCALIAVDEILSTIQDLKCEDVNWDYWIQVKQEIRNL